MPPRFICLDVERVPTFDRGQYQYVGFSWFEIEIWLLKIGSGVFPLLNVMFMKVYITSMLSCNRMIDSSFWELWIRFYTVFSVILSCLRLPRNHLNIRKSLTTSFLDRILTLIRKKFFCLSLSRLSPNGKCDIPTLKIQSLNQPSPISVAFCLVRSRLI